MEAESCGQGTLMFHSKSSQLNHTNNATTPHAFINAFAPQAVTPSRQSHHARLSHHRSDHTMQDDQTTPSNSFAAQLLKTLSNMINYIAPNFLHEDVHKEVQCGGAGIIFVVAHAESAERRLVPIHIVTPMVGQSDRPSCHAETH